MSMSIVETEAFEMDDTRASRLTSAGRLLRTEGERQRDSILSRYVGRRAA